MRLAVRIQKTTEWPNGDTSTLTTPYDGRPWEIFEIHVDGSEELIAHRTTRLRALAAAWDTIDRRSKNDPLLRTLPEHVIPALRFDDITAGMAMTVAQFSDLPKKPEGHFSLTQKPIDPLTMKLFFSNFDAAHAEAIEADRELEELKAWLAARLVDATRSADNLGAEAVAADAVEYLFDHEFIDLEQATAARIAAPQEAPC